MVEEESAREREREREREIIITERQVCLEGFMKVKHISLIPNTCLIPGSYDMSLYPIPEEDGKKC